MMSPELARSALYGYRTTSHSGGLGSTINNTTTVDDLARDLICPTCAGILDRSILRRRVLRGTIILFETRKLDRAVCQRDNVQRANPEEETVSHCCLTRSGIVPSELEHASCAMNRRRSDSMDVRYEPQ